MPHRAVRSLGPALVLLVLAGPVLAQADKHAALAARLTGRWVFSQAETKED